MSLINDALKRARQTQSQRPPERPAGPSLQPVERRQPSTQLNRWAAPAIVGVLLLLSFALLWVWHRSRNTSVAELTPAQTTTTALVQPIPDPLTPPAPAQPQPSHASAIRVSTNLVARGPQKADGASPLAAAGSPASSAPSPSVQSPLPPEREAKSEPSATSTAPVVETSAKPQEATNAVSTPTLTAAQLPASISGSPTVAAARTQSFPSLKLQAIYYRLSRPSAMINGQTVEIGDSIEDIKVTKIERNTVTVELGGQQKVLRLSR